MEKETPMKEKAKKTKPAPRGWKEYLERLATEAERDGHRMTLIVVNEMLEEL